jgi:hypothetical protein
LSVFESLAQFKYHKETRQMYRNFLLLLAASFLILATGACLSSTPPPAPTAAPPVEATPTSPPALPPTEAPTTYVSPPAEVCEALRVSVADTLGVEATVAEAPFADYLQTAPPGTGCTITVTGTGANFLSTGGTADSLRAMLAGQGWVEDINYAADGPTGTASGYWQDNRLALLSVGWEPSPDANCPPDQPISACELAPEQQLYTITLSVGELPPGVNPPAS